MPDSIQNKEDLKSGVYTVRELYENFLFDVKVPSGFVGPNIELEKALRLMDFFELSELMLQDALHREESCGAHFREEFQTPEGEARRNDRDFSHIAAWEFIQDSKEARLHKEPLRFEKFKPVIRNYK